MVKIKINGAIYRIANSWKDVTYGNLLATCNNTFEELKVFSDIPVSILSHLSEEQMFGLAQPLDFLNDDEDLTLYVKSLPIVNVEEEAYEKLELARQAISDNKKLYKILTGIALVYYPNERNVIKLLSLGYHLLIAIQSFLANYADMFTKTATNEEINAGIKELSAFGVFGTAFTLAGKDILKMDKILATPAISIYTALLYSYREGEYVKTLYEIKYGNNNKTS